jgi:hypothetical protein
MELDEMRLAWRELGAKLEQQRTLNLRLIRNQGLDKLRRGLRPLVWGQSLQLLIGVALATWAVTFWVSHRQVLHLLVCGLLMQGFGLLMILSAARVLELVRRVDHGAPVTVIQHQLAQLRKWRVKVEAPIDAIVGSFIWIPAFVMAFASSGFDPWAPGLGRWAVLSGAASLGLVAMGIWLALRLGYGRRLENHAAGSSVLAAEDALDEIARFEQE